MTAEARTPVRSTHPTPPWMPSPPSAWWWCSKAPQGPPGHGGPASTLGITPHWGRKAPWCEAFWGYWERTRDVVGKLVLTGYSAVCTHVLLGYVSGSSAFLSAFSSSSSWIRQLFKVRSPWGPLVKASRYKILAILLFSQSWLQAHPWWSCPCNFQEILMFE